MAPWTGLAGGVVVGQDPSSNELLAHRILIGSAGQRLQGFLRKLGLTRSYVMGNAFLYSVFGQFDVELRAISLEAPILDYRNALLDRRAQRTTSRPSSPSATGRSMLSRLAEAALPVFQITHPRPGTKPRCWPPGNASLPSLLSVVGPDYYGQPDPDARWPRFQPADIAPSRPTTYPLAVPRGRA